MYVSVCAQELALLALLLVSMPYYCITSQLILYGGDVGAGAGVAGEEAWLENTFSSDTRASRDTAGSNRSSEDSLYTRRDVLIGHVPTLEQRLQSLQSAWLAKAAPSELAAADLHLPLAAGAPHCLF